MRRFLLVAVGLITAACGLSFNPDLPSSHESDGSSGDGDNFTGDGDVTGSDGDGDMDVSTPPEHEGFGGAGGAGGTASKR